MDDLPNLEGNVPPGSLEGMRTAGFDNVDVDKYYFIKFAAHLHLPRFDQFEVSKVISNANDVIRVRVAKNYAIVLEGRPHPGWINNAGYERNITRQEVLNGKYTFYYPEAPPPILPPILPPEQNGVGRRRKKTKRTRKSKKTRKHVSKRR